jgi:glutathione S-transferase
MSPFTIDNPVFTLYVLAAGLAILKMLGHAFLTVQRMVKVNGGFLNAEDTRRTLMNPHPSPTQIGTNDYVERARRLHRNEGENTPLFLVAGLLLVAASPSTTVAVVFLFGYIAARVAHTWAYLTERDHEVRATCFTLGAALTAGMVVYAGTVALLHSATLTAMK